MTRPIRPGDQPLPTAGTGPGMHDLVIAALREHGGATLEPVVELLTQRRDIGLERYGRPLQAWNGRDALRDLAEELADAIVYARQAGSEGYPLAELEVSLVHLLSGVLAMHAPADPAVAAQILGSNS